MTTTLNPNCLLHRVGGRSVLERVHKRFYDLIYEDAWLGQIFKDVSQEHIEAQQTDFMVGAMGGPKLYRGRAPKDAHPHIYITHAMFDRRTELLAQSLRDERVPQEPAARWLMMDGAFRGRLVKGSKDECKPRWGNEPIIDPVRPAGHNMTQGKTRNK